MFSFWANMLERLLLKVTEIFSATLAARARADSLAEVARLQLELHQRARELEEAGLEQQAEELGRQARLLSAPGTDPGPLADRDIHEMPALPPDGGRLPNTPALSGGRGRQRKAP